MATSNVTLGPVWSLLATTGDEFFLSLPFSSRVTVEIAVSDTEVVPVVPIGHLLRGEGLQEMNRALLGPGYVYARSAVPGVNAVLTAWTP